MIAKRLLVGIALGSIVFGACGQPARDDAASSPSRRTEASPSDGQNSVTTASCVEQYSLDALRERDYAFDGTVTKVDEGSESSEQPDPDRVTFEVREWFKGGSGDAAVRRAYSFGAITSAGGEQHEVGDRLLVAGDDDFIWPCGFTQDHDASIAEEWRATLKD